ncbi:MAG TPA: cytochrome c [Acetobacteraceae bacterium]
MSVLAEVVLGAMVMLAASNLASLPPGMHEEPIWPFPVQLSLEAFQDPDLAWDVTQGLVLFGVGVALAFVGLFWRRVRWPAIVLGLGMGGIALPHARLLLVPAYPTSFYTSPTGFDAVGIADGARLFAQNCASCHGADGRGDGPLAKRLDIPPADLTAPHLWEHSDGELFWWLTHGIDSPRGGLAMPGFAATLDEGQRWAVIDDIRAHNAGVALGSAASWPDPVQAPALAADCGGGQVVQLSDLRGKVVRIVVGPAVSSPDVPTIFLDPGAPKPDACVAAAPEVRAAYAIIAGVTPDALAGTSFLIDANGWLRELRRPDDPALTPATLAEAVRRFAPQPLAAPAAAHHH